MVDFEFYLNRQGPQGVKGSKGDTGFSPVITVNTSTSTEYTLDIQNETYSFTTPNLRPQLTESEGTYVRVDSDGNWYLGDVDTADEDRAGIVRLAGLEDVANRNDTTAISPDVFSETLTDFILVSNDITKTVSDTGVITLDVDFSELETTISNISAALIKEVNDRTNADASLISAINTEINDRKSADSSLNYTISALNTTLTAEINTKQDIISDLSTIRSNAALVSTKQDTLVSGTNIKTINGNSILGSGNIVIEGGGGSGDVTAAGDNTFTGTNTFDKDTQFNSGITIHNGSLSRQIYLNSSGNLQLGNSLQVGDTYINTDYIKDTTNDSYYLTQSAITGSETIEVTTTEKGIQLNANLDEIGEEMSAISSRVTALEDSLSGVETIIDEILGTSTESINTLVTDINGEEVS